MKLWRVLALSSLARTNAAHERPPLSESETRLDVGMGGAKPSFVGFANRTPVRCLA